MMELPVDRTCAVKEPSGGLQHDCQQQPLQPKKRQATKAAISGAVIKAMSQLLQLKRRLL